MDYQLLYLVTWIEQQGILRFTTVNRSFYCTSIVVEDRKQSLAAFLFMNFYVQ